MIDNDRKEYQDKLDKEWDPYIASSRPRAGQSHHDQPLGNLIIKKIFDFFLNFFDFFFNFLNFFFNFTDIQILANPRACSKKCSKATKTGKGLKIQIEFFFQFSTL